MVETATFFQGTLTAILEVEVVPLLFCCTVCPVPPLFDQCLSVDGEHQVKTRSQMGYFWPPPMPGDEQMNPKPMCLAILGASNERHPRRTF